MELHKRAPPLCGDSMGGDSMGGVDGVCRALKIQNVGDAMFGWHLACAIVLSILIGFQSGTGLVQVLQRLIESCQWVSRPETSGARV